MSLTEQELVGTPGYLLTPAPEVIEMLEAMARELSTCRELLELLVDWAGARDRPAPDDAA